MDNVVLRGNLEYDTEIFTTGFPRTGNTWMWRTCCDLFDAPMASLPDEPQITDFCTYVSGQFIVRKTHWHRSRYPEVGYNGRPSKIVLVIRDPRDMIVSMMHYRNQSIISDVILSILDENLHGTGFESFVNGWIEDRPDCTIRYEHMHHSSGEALTVLWTCIYGVSKKLDYSKILDVIENQKFVHHAPKFPHSMRKGIIGDWRNYFSIANCELMEEKLGPTMRKLGYTKEDWVDAERAKR
jgi:hypothetical protein